MLVYRCLSETGVITYLSADPGTEEAIPANSTIHQVQVKRGVPDGSNKQMLVTTTSHEQVHIQVVDDWIRGILNLDSEGTGDVVRECACGELTRGCERRPRKEERS